MPHLRLEDAIQAIGRVFNNTDRPMEDTMRDLREIEDHVSVLIDTLRCDIKKRDGE